MDEGDLVQDRYRLDSLLGQGGMAEVWRALDERLRRPVAIKFLTGRFADDPEFLVRFFSEAQVIARISHENVVRVLDFGSSGDRPFLVMELIEGGPLAAGGEPMPLERALKVVSLAAAGAGAAHELGIVHRDIKPANILLTPGGRAKLADFGIATLGRAESLTATGRGIGSPSYISPEGAKGAGSSPASDVYSLGVVLYELLTGRLPFDGSSPTAIAIAQVERTPEAPSTHRRELPQWIDSVILTCLAKDPEERFPDGNALAEALARGDAVVPSSPVIGSTATSPRSSKRAAAAVGVVSVLALGGFLWASPGREMSAGRTEATEQGSAGARPRTPPREASPSVAGLGVELDGEPAGPSKSPEAKSSRPPEDRDSQAGSATATPVPEEPSPTHAPPSRTPTEEPTEEPSPSPSPSSQETSAAGEQQQEPSPSPSSRS